MKLELLTLIRDKKKLTTNVLLISISFILLNVLLLCISYVDYYIDNNIANKSINRIFAVGIDDNETKENVENVINNNLGIIEYSYLTYRRFSINYNDYNIILNNYLSLENKSQINKVVDKYEIIVSDKFLTLNNLNINDNIIVKINDEDIKLKIVDVVNNQSIDMIYANGELIDDIANKLGYNYSDYIIKINDYKNMKLLNKSLKEKNLTAILFDSTGQEELEYYTNFKTTFKLILIPLLIGITILLFWIIKSIFYNERKNIAIKKLVGYSNIKCAANLLYKGFIYIILSIILAIIIVFIVGCILILNNSTIKQFLLNYNIYMIELITCGILIILYTLSHILNIKKVIKLNPIFELNIE